MLSCANLVLTEGNTLLDVPIDEVLDTHKLNKGFITCLLKETSVGKKQMEYLESPDIYGLNSEILDSERSQVPMRALGPLSAVQNNRLVFKTTKVDVKSGNVQVKQSLLKKENQTGCARIWARSACTSSATSR